MGKAIASEHNIAGLLIDTLTIIPPAILSGESFALTGNELTFDGTGPMLLQLGGGAANMPATIDNDISIVSGDLTVSVNNAAHTLTLSGVISTTAAHGLIKQLPGTVELTNSNTYTGPTTVTGGTLKVATGGAGSTATTVQSGATLIVDGTLNGNTTIGSGGLLMGSEGTINGVTNIDGNHNPGNSIGTQTINGAYNINSTGKLIVELDASSGLTSDKVIVSGGNTVTIDPSATIEFKNLGGTFTVGSAITFLDATGGTISPATPANPFGTVLSDAFPGLSLIITRGSPILQVNFVDASLAAMIAGGNPHAVAGCIDVLTGSDIDIVKIEISKLADNCAKRRALNQLHPAQIGDMALQSHSNIGLISSLTCRHVGFLRDGLGRGENRKLWAELLGSINDRSEDDDAIGYRAYTGGAVVGGDLLAMPENNLRIGGVASFAYNDFEWDRNQGTGKSYDGTAGIYACWHTEPFFVNAGITAGGHEFRSHRHIMINTLDRRANQSHHAFSGALHLDGGVNIPFRDIDIQPFASFDYSFMHEHSFTETGADSLNLHVNNNNTDMLRSELGLSIAGSKPIGNSFITQALKLSYINKVGIHNRRMVFQFAGAGDCVVSAYNKPVHLISPGVALTVENEALGLHLTAHYDGQFGPHHINNILGVKGVKRF